MDAPPRAVIDVRGLHKSFGTHQVLAGIDLAVEEGSTCVILGGSGSGKTVLMKHMIGLLKPDRGQVLVDGEDIVPLGDEALEQVRRKFGMVFQAAALFDSMTVYENVSFPLREHTRSSEAQMRDIVRQKLEIVGLRGVEEKYPADLSGGMRKRVGLARAIVLDPIDLYEGLIKGAIFGLSVTLVCCYKGFHASGGAKGVGQATTQAMVASALSIFILDFFVGVMLH